MPNNSTLYFLFTPHHAKHRLQAASCWEWNQMPHPFSIWKQKSPRLGGPCAPLSPSPPWPQGCYWHTAKAPSNSKKKKYFNGVIVIFYTQAGFWYHQTQRTSKKIRPKLPPHFLILKWRSKQRGVSKTTELDKFFKINLAEACWVSLVLEMMKFKRMELKSGHEVVIRKVSK